MWRAIKETLPSNRCGINAIFSDGKLQTDPTSIAETLNNHFSSIGKKLAKAFSSALSDQCFACSSNFSLQPVTISFVEEQLSQLKINKAIGLDNISARLLRDSASVLARSLQYIINLSLESGRFPSSWKCAKVTALFKQGDRSDKDN